MKKEVPYMDIINGRILTMEGEIHENGYVRIHGKKIEKVGDMSEYQPLNNKEKVLDVNRAWVMPGLIESHAHIGITEEKWGCIADDCNEATKPVTATLRAIDAVNPMDPAFHDAIAAGITSVMVGPGSTNVVGGQFLFMKTQGRCIDKMVVKHPAAMKVAFGENPKNAYGTKDMYPSTRMGIAAMLRKTLYEGLKAITINAAKICRVDKNVGSLKKGKDADIAIFSGNPMEVFTKTLYTIIDGKIVYDNSEE